MKNRIKAEGESPSLLSAMVLRYLSNEKNHLWMVATETFFIFTPIPGEMIQFDEHIFQMGWFNHQLDLVYRELYDPVMWGL